MCSDKEGLCDGKDIEVELEGGKLHIEYNKELGVFMTGPAEFSFEGRLNF